MTRDEVKQRMFKCRERRIVLEISAQTIGRQLGYTGTAVTNWERFSDEPREVIVLGYEALLDKLESGEVTLPRWQRPGNNGVVYKARKCLDNAPEISLYNAAVTLGLLRRLLGISDLVGTTTLGLSSSDFQFKEAGLKVMTREEMSRLLTRYAKEILQDV